MTDRETLSAAVTASGLSAHEFARWLDLNPRTLARWLNGSRQVPREVAELARACVAFYDVRNAATR